MNPQGSPIEKIPATDRVKTIYSRYQLGMQNLQTPQPFLNGKSPIEYWADGRLRFNVYVPQRAKDSKAWKSLYRSAITRNKILGIIAHIIGMLPSPNFQAQNDKQDEDVIAAQFFKDLVDFSMEHEGFDIKAFWGLVTAVAEGTIIFKDDYGVFERTVKEIVDIDDESGQIKWKEGKKIDFKGAFTELVSNDELLIPNPFVTDIQLQDWLIRRKRMPYETAKRRYGKFKNWDKVKPGMPTNWLYSCDEFQPYSVSTYLANNMVEVIEHWEMDGDHYDVSISGVQMTDDDNPNPRHDKKYPFAKSGFEPIDYGFFWFKSLADKLSPEQEVYDTMLRQMIDRQHIRNIPVILTNNPSLVNEDIVVPGNVVYVGAAENAKVETIKGFDTTTDAGTANILQTMMSNMSSSSLDPMQMGTTPDGGTPSATQAVQMAQNAKVMLGLFGWLYGYLVTEWAKLRCQTIIWRLSKDLDFSKITLSDKILKNGKVGKRTYLLERGLKKKTETQRMEISKKISDLQGKLEGREEIIALDPDELSELSLFVRMDSQPQPKRTDAVMQALAAEKWNIKSKNPEVWNLNYAARQLSQAWNEDPDEAINKQANATEELAEQGQDQQLQPQTPMMKQLKGGLAKAAGVQKGTPQQMATLSS